MMVANLPTQPPARHRRREFNNLGAFFGIFGVLALVGAVYVVSQRNQYAGGAAVGGPAPDFELRALGSDTVRLHNLRGQPMIISFVASWCSQCHKAAPWLESVNRQYAGELTMLAIAVQDAEITAREFAARYDWTFRFLVDIDDTVSRRYRIVTIPAIFFVDRAGIIRARISGVPASTQFSQYLIAIGVEPQ